MKKLFGFFGILLLVASAVAQDVVISPQAIVVNPRPSFDVEVWVDKAPGGESIPTYRVGEEIEIGVRVSESAYVYLFSVRSDGEVTQILPNRFDDAGRNNFVRAGQTTYFPPRGARYVYEVRGPQGLDKVIAVASKRELNTRELASFERDPNFATSTIGEDRFAETLSIIVRPIPQQDWVTSTALFYVGQRTEPAFGALDIRSRPSGAEVYVDGRFAGYTPVNYGVRPGQREVRVELAGYEPFRTTVNIAGGQTRTVDAELRSVRRTGTVYFESRPSGAEVLVGGRVIGVTPTGPVTLDEGSYQARFRRAGFDESVVNFTVRGGASQTVTGDLREQFGTLELRANVGGARVFLNGEAVGTIPSGSGRLTLRDLRPDRYQITLVAAGYSTEVREVTIRSGQTTTLEIRQTRR